MADDLEEVVVTATRKPDLTYSDLLRVLATRKLDGAAGEGGGLLTDLPTGEEILDEITEEDSECGEGKVKVVVTSGATTYTGCASISEVQEYIGDDNIARVPSDSNIGMDIIKSATDTEDTEEQDPRLLEAIKTHGQAAVDDALAKIKEFETIIGKAVDDPFGTLEGIITSTSSGTKSCRESNPSDWIRNCVTVGVTLPIPLPLPGPLGGIFKGATIGEIEEAIKSAGHKINEVLSGETSVEEVIEDLGDWIGDKVKSVLGDKEKDGQITIESVLGAIGGFLPNVAAGVIWSTFQNKIENKLNLPILLTTEDGTEDSRCRDAEGNLTPWGERNPASCGQPITFEESDLFGTGGLDSTVECDEGTADGKGNCVCPDGTLEDRNGKCADTVVDTEVDPRCSNPSFAARNPSLCGGQTTFTEGTGFGFTDDDTTETRCTDVNATVNKDGSCGDCKEGYSRKPGETTCTADGTTTGGGDDTTTVDGDDCSNITDANAAKCGKQKCSDGSFVDANADCPGSGGPECPSKGTVLESGCDGTTFFIRFADGECGEIYDSVPGYSGCGGGGYECDDPNATVREDGSCGPCKAGYVFNGALERCVQESVTNPCNDATYAAANPQECGTGSECVDCSCAEYAAANPEECGTTPPPPPPSGGGGGGAGGSSFGSGMFEMTPTDITAAPELLAAAQFPIVDFLSDALPKDVKSNVMKGLFEGLV